MATVYRRTTGTDPLSPIGSPRSGAEITPRRITIASARPQPTPPLSPKTTPPLSQTMQWPQQVAPKRLVFPTATTVVPSVVTDQVFSPRLPPPPPQLTVASLPVGVTEGIKHRIQSEGDLLGKPMLVARSSYHECPIYLPPQETTPAADDTSESTSSRRDDLPTPPNEPTVPNAVLTGVNVKEPHRIRKSVASAKAARHVRLNSRPSIRKFVSMRCPKCRGDSERIGAIGYWAERGETILACIRTRSGSLLPSSPTDICGCMWTTPCRKPTCLCGSRMVIQARKDTYTFVCKVCGDETSNPYDLESDSDTD